MIGHSRRRAGTRLRQLRDLAHRSDVCIDRAGAERWVAVTLRDGRSGYVASHLARSPLDYRAIFAKSSGRWQLVAFVAGD